MLYPPENIAQTITLCLEEGKDLYLHINVSGEWKQHLGMVVQAPDPNS